MAKMSGTPKFNVAFKRQAVADAQQIGIRAAGRKHGVSQVSVSKWMKSGIEAKQHPQKTAVLRCPHCDQTFQRPQGLSGHVRYKHGSLAAIKVAPPLEKVEIPTADPMPDEATMTVGAANTGVSKYLKTALEQLTRRQRQIEQELGRMEALQAEREVIRKQIDALSVAMQAFGVK
jgi:hypothetical protein